MLRAIGVAVALLAAVHASAGITYQLRRGAKTPVLFNIAADGSSYRAEIEPGPDLSEWSRQYPITISVDGGQTHRLLRPENRTWYERPNARSARGIPMSDDKEKIRKPKVTLIEETSTEEFAGQPTRKYVLQASCVIETDMGPEIVKLHVSKTVLIWVADIDCAPKAVRRLFSYGVGVAEVDAKIEQALETIDGFIVREVHTITQRYEGGRPQVALITSDVIDPRCGDVPAALFAIPNGWEYREAVIGHPGR